MSTFNIDTFNKNLKLTQQYCARQMSQGKKSVAEVFRSINPEYFGEKIFGYETGNFPLVKWRVDPSENDSEISDLFNIQLATKDLEFDVSTEDLNTNGKTLCCSLNCTVTDGTSEFESSGFVDVYDLPPIDTWLFILDTAKGKILYSWVPDKYIPLANAAIDVNMLGIFYWDNNRDIDKT